MKTGKTGTTDVRKWRPEGRRRHPGLIEGYDAPDGVADELLKPDGSLRPVWRPLINHLAALPPEALAQRFARGDQYLRDAGVYYRQYSDAGSTERAWPLSHIPVMIGQDEWAGLAEGIAQRADLLERVNSGIAAIRENGTYDALSEPYFAGFDIYGS